MKTQIIIATKMLLVMTVITGIAYPLLITGIAQAVFHHKANGSLIEKDGKVVGSELIGQKFDTTFYFWSRPSAVDYNPLPSGGSNYGPTSAKLKKFVDEKRTQFISLNNIKDSSIIPCEMITASASGLDPDISPKAALMQVYRIAKARNFSTNQTQQLIQCIKSQTETPQFLVLGEESVNVLLLNLNVDRIK